MPFVRDLSQHRSTPPPPSSVPASMKARAPKIQQQSWDDCGKPSIQLYDPASVVVHHPSLPALPPRSPTTRSSYFADSPLAQQPSTHHTQAMSTATAASSTAASGKNAPPQNHHRSTGGAGGYYYETRSPKSPRKFTYDYDEPQQHQQQHQMMSQQLHGSPVVPPRSPKIVYSNGDAGGSGCGGDFYEMASCGGSSSGGSYETARRSPLMPKKFVFDAVSPRSEDLNSPTQQQQHHPYRQQHPNQQHHQLQQGTISSGHGE